MITTVLDPGEASGQALVELYHQRWEIEAAYCELKSTMLGGRVLRGRYPAAVAQEIRALLSVCQVLRIAVADAALAGMDLPVDRLSFTTALLAARAQVVRAQMTVTVSRTGFLGWIGTAVPAAVMPSRRTRTRIRVIKRAISKCRAKNAMSTAPPIPPR